MNARALLAAIGFLAIAGAACQPGAPAVQEKGAVPQADAGPPTQAAVAKPDPGSDGLLIPTGAMAADASPEVRELGRLIGSWTMKGVETAAAVGDAATAYNRFSCGWFAGGKSVVCSIFGEVAGMSVVQVEFYSYDASTKSYKVQAALSNGVTATGTVSLQPGALIRTLDLKDDRGTPIRSRVTMHNMVLGGGDFKAELSAMDGPYATVWQGTFTKVR